MSEVNTNRTNETVPAGAAGCWVTLHGGGGGGGGGRRASSGSCGGGGGGGGGGQIERVFIPASSLGATYSVVWGLGGSGGGGGSATNGTNGANGNASTFTSSSVSLSAGGGGAGNGGGTVAATAGAGGTCSASGVTATTHDGTAGGAGQSNVAGTAAAANSNGAAAGGGGGGGTNGAAAAGGSGGSSSTVSGGAAGSTTIPAGSAPSNAAAPNGGGGGGGAGSRITTSAAQNGGPGGLFGGGGGGGGGKQAASTSAGDGGAGGNGYTEVEWALPFTSSPVFDALGGGTGGGASSHSYSHTIGSTANAIVVFVNFQAVAGARPSVSGTVGGQALTELATVSYYDTGGNAHHLVALGKLNPLTGAQTVALTLGASMFTAVNSMSYRNVASFGTAVTGNALNGSATLTVSSAADQMVAQAFSDFTTSFTSYNKTERWNRALNSLGSGNVSIVLGDSVGASSVNFTASTGTAWGGIGIPMLPSPAVGSFFALF